MKEYKFKINGNNYNVLIEDFGETTASVEVNGTPFQVEYEKQVNKPAIKVIRPSAPQTITPSPGRDATSTPAPSAGGTTITSPLPGVVFDINVKEGDTVKAGQTILVLEAMKMENAIETSVDGVVKSIKVNKGESVLEGAPLVIIG